MPEVTKSFVLSDWYYADFHKCPHDAWVDSLEIVERASGERKQLREIHIKLKLFAASHQGHIYYTYENVSQYGLNARWLYCRTGPKHEDWLNDEITLAGTGEWNTKSCFARARNGIFGAKVSLMNTGLLPIAPRIRRFDCVLPTAR